MLWGCFGMGEFDKQSTSAWNVADEFQKKLIITRFDEANVFNRLGHYGYWHLNLDMIYRMCAGKMTAEELAVFGKVRGEAIRYKGLYDEYNVLSRTKYVNAGQLDRSVVVGYVNSLAKYEELLATICHRLGWFGQDRKTIFDTMNEEDF